MKLHVEDNNTAHLSIADNEGIGLRVGDVVNIGTRSYSELTDKPTLEGVELDGSMTLDDVNAYTQTEVDTLLSAKANTEDLAEVATSGSYNDLEDKPSIPVVPTNVSAFNNDAGYLTGYTETDPTVPSWAKAPSKPTYTASEVGALADDTPIPTKVSDLNNDAGFITTETDPTVPAWAKASSKPSYTASEVGALPSNTTYVSTVNGNSGAVTVNEALTPLIGDTDDITPTQVKTALREGRDICIAHIGTLEGMNLDLRFTSWNGATDLPYSGAYVDIVASQTIAQFNGHYYLFELVGSSNGVWDLFSTLLAKESDIPTKVSDLTNDSNFTTKTYVDDADDDIRGKLFFGIVDGTSTSTVFTATIEGVTEYVDGLAVMLKNGVVTSAAGFTININGLGAKPAYSNMAAATAESTMFNVNYTMLFVYDSTRIEGGCWILYRGYNANDNTIGYQVRTNLYSLRAKDKFVRYRLLFTSADHAHFVPANTSTSTNATSKRDTNQSAIDPFGPIVYYGTTAAVAVDARPAVGSLWQQYGVALGYSFNRTGAALTLTSWKPVYLKCAPQADCSAIIEAETPFVQDLPTTNDGKIYIFLGVAYSATNIELNLSHPVYYHDGTSIRLWTGPTA